MQPFPHVYVVAASGHPAGSLELSSKGVPRLTAAAPAEFDGPGNEWSPESLLMASLSSCFLLTFKSVARIARVEWTQLECSVTGTLERHEGVTQFTKLVTRARLKVPNTTLVEACEKALHKAEASCLVANSMRAQRELQIEVIHEGCA